jgi:hypothetical protein
LGRGRGGEAGEFGGDGGGEGRFFEWLCGRWREGGLFGGYEGVGGGEGFGGGFGVDVWRRRRRLAF